MLVFVRSLPMVLFCLFWSIGNTQISEETALDIQEIPFTLSEDNNWIFEAILNEKDTLKLMLHTAASGLTLIEESADRYPSVTWNESDAIKTWGGDEVARTSHFNTFQLKDFKLDSIPIWENRFSGPGTDGKFGLGLLNDHIISLDFDHYYMIISEALPEDISSYEAFKVEHENGLIFIQAESILEDTIISHRFLIHSGYGSCILYDDEFAAQYSFADRLEIVNSKILKDAYGNEIVTKQAILPQLKLGSFELSNVPVGFFEGSIGRQKVSVMGGDILRRFNMVIDLKKDTIYLKPGQNIDLAYTKF